MRPATSNLSTVPHRAPLAETLGRLREVYGPTGPIVGVPAGGRWLRLDELSEKGLDQALEHARRGEKRRTDYVGAAVAAALADALVGTALPCLLAERRLPDVAPANLSVRLHETEPWFEGVAIHRPRGHVLATDPAAADPDLTVVRSVDDLHHRLASVIVDAASPWFAAIRARAPFGRRGMWGQLADGLCGTALWTARAVGLDPREAWDEVQAIVDLVADSAPELRARPRLFPVPWSGTVALWHVKGTCCLWYTTFDQPDTCGEGYCTTCPLRPDDVRLERLRRWLETEAESAG